LATEVLVRVGLTGAAFVGALLAVVLTLVLARGVQHTMRLLLAGVIVGVVMGAMASLVSMMRPDILQNMQGYFGCFFSKSILFSLSERGSFDNFLFASFLT
jgi:iron complex transport system permease protein